MKEEKLGPCLHEWKDQFPGSKYQICQKCHLRHNPDNNQPYYGSGEIGDMDPV